MNEVDKAELLYVLRDTDFYETAQELCQLHDRYKSRAEALREAWQEWLDLPEEMFISPEMLNAMSDILEDHELEIKGE